MNKNSQISLFGRAALFALASTAMLFAQEPAAAPAGSVEPETATAPAAATPAAEAPAPSAEPAVAATEPAAAAPAAEQPAAASATEGGEAKTASIFVQDPAIFHQRQADLEKLKGSLQNVNEGLDSLLADASHIAKMNDQCAAVSINDVMGDECWTFYQVELPAFEEKYMQVTGEVRLGHMETARGLEDRKLQINACVDALYSFAASKDQFLNLKGGVFLEPLAKGFEAHYDFTLQYEPNHRKNALAIAQKWGETCREMVVRQDGEGFAPYFIERLDRLNKDLARDGSLAIYKVDTAAAPTVYMDIAKPVRSAYYLNGVKLFHSRIAAGPVDESNIRIKFENGAAKVEGAEVVVQHGKPQQFKGAVQFAEKAAMMNGRREPPRYALLSLGRGFGRVRSLWRQEPHRLQGRRKERPRDFRRRCRRRARKAQLWRDRRRLHCRGRGRLHRCRVQGRPAALVRGASRTARTGLQGLRYPRDCCDCNPRG